MPVPRLLLPAALLLLPACAGGAAGWRRLPPPPPPSARDQTPLHAIAMADDVPIAGAFCERLDDAAAWRTWQARLAAGGAFGREPDFAVERVLAVGTGNGPFAPGFALQVGTEEGVDVLTMTQQVAGDGHTRTPAILLLLPRRTEAMAVVLRRFRGHEPLGETTLRVFDATR